MTEPGILFTLKTAGESSIDHGRAFAATYQLTGHAWVDGSSLVIEWGGSSDITEVGPGLVRQATRPIPVGRVTVPVARLVGIELRGRWWRPRIELISFDPGAFSAVPSGAGGRLRLYLPRHQMAPAQEWVTTVKLEMADHALRAAEAEDQLPPPSPE